MSRIIERKTTTAKRLGVGKTFLYDNFVDHDPADPFVPHTNNTVRRLKPVPLGLRAIGFFSDEVDALLDALGKFREIAPPRKPAVPDRTTDNKKKKTTARKRAA
jgi:hypothetical protein